VAPIERIGNPVGVRVKICGVRRPEDARTAARLGADYLGLICAPSPRRLDLAGSSWLAEVRAEFPRVQWVGVFVNPDAMEMIELSARLQLDLVQIHGVAPSQVRSDRPWIWATHAARFLRSPWSRGQTPPIAPFAILLDTPDPARAGGTGRCFDWRSIENVSSAARLFLAGGLGPDNVASAIAAVRPFAVDASSRLERAPGEKDPELLAAFFAAIARAREEILEDPHSGRLHGE
jgi:phosphoribosylanthranilate isomerase